MYLKLSFILFSAVFWSGGRLAECDRLVTVGAGSSETTRRLDRLLPEDYYEKNTIVEVNDCGGNLTVAPGKIDLLIKDNRRCTWKIHAPSSHHVYIEEITVNYDVKLEASGTRDNSLVIDVYEGDRVNVSKRLYRFGKDQLDNAISHGRYLTINMMHDNRSETYSNHRIVILYHFIDHHDYYIIKDEILGGKDD
ncbi:hypothetical protein TSAR_007361 [Trichomalopsis sarcophagae]|uniref:CUB domain-containing protein n=1 Tax=Trichomalopsis sarcophagae TaxID=543379 RepID=A0A232FJS7_9HYME|nr:hypothetical protein TSAR_007361 [Trichomalopsis sarcophagae]